MNNLYLIPFAQEHLDSTYRWIGGGGNNLKNSFLFSRTVSYVDHLAWFQSISADQTQKIYAIVLGDEHIGNIGLKSIDRKSHKAEVWIYIGNELYRGMGIATRAIKEICIKARNFELHKLYANIASWNISSLKAFSNAGFNLEGILKDEIYFGEQYVNIDRYGLIL